MNKLSNGHLAIGAPGSVVREQQEDQIAKEEAIRRLDLPEGHSYGCHSSAAKFVEAFIEGAKWNRNKD